jgi:hypothetical protein
MVLFYWVASGNVKTELLQQHCFCFCCCNCLAVCQNVSVCTTTRIAATSSQNQPVSARRILYPIILLYVGFRFFFPPFFRFSIYINSNVQSKS